MTEFLAGIFQNLVADVIFAIIGLLIAWLVARRFRWRTIAAIFRLQRNGVSNLYLERSEYISRRPVLITNYIEGATKSFEYIGIYFSLGTDQSRIDDTILTLIKKGCQVKIVLLDDAAADETFHFLEDHFALARDSLKPRVQHAREYFAKLKNSLAPGQKPLFDICIHRLPLTASAFILDRRERKSGLLVDSKWYGAGREKSFGIEFAGKIEEGSLFDTLVKSFVKIAEQAAPI